jgi:thiol:disulfide interchange protein DsbD
MNAKFSPASSTLPIRINSGKLFSGNLALRWAICALFVALAVISVRAGAQDQPFPAAASVLQPQAYVSLQPVPRGHAFQVAVVAKISPGFHINAHVPSEDYLIPTKVTAELPAGLFVVETNYPRGVMRAFRFSKTPLRVYEGSFTILMKLRTNGSAPVGPQKIKLTVGYQACNQDACLPPTKLPVSADLEIAAAETAAKPVHPEIFSAGGGEKTAPKP